MQISKSLVVLTVVFVAGLGWTQAQRGRTSDTLSPQDFLEIEQLVQAYAHGIDIGPEDPSWVFAPDGVFVRPNGDEVRGAKALKEFYAGVTRNHATNRPKERHVLSNLMIKATPEGAAGSVYVTTIDADDSKVAGIRWYGMYADTFVKTPAGWRIKRRVDTHAQ
jgi:hypothetical protein